MGDFGSDREGASQRTLPEGGAQLHRLARALVGLSLRPLPWRVRPLDAWRLLVAEVMLIQTQAERVAGPWRAFTERFPTPHALARADLGDVLRLWEGLGYYRRAVWLHHAARMIVAELGGECPIEEETLRLLPGVGRYVARAVAVQTGAAVGVPIDTNARRVLQRALLASDASDRELEVLGVELARAAPADRLVQAIFDLGARWCRARPRCGTCPIASVCRMQVEGATDPCRAVRVHDPYEGSWRQQRARLLRTLLRGPQTTAGLVAGLGVADSILAQLLAELHQEGFVVVGSDGSVALATR